MLSRIANSFFFITVPPFFLDLSDPLFPPTADILEKENEFKDLENLVDLKAVSKTIRYLKRKDEPKKIILDKIQAKYELSREEARTIYKSSNKQTKWKKTMN